MCHAINVLHNTYVRHHTIYKYDDEHVESVHATHRPRTVKGRVHIIYDISTVQIHYGYMSYKTQKLADVSMSPYIPDDVLLRIIKDLETFFTDKTLEIVKLNEKFVYLYYNQECINTMINNMIMSYVMQL